MDWFQAISTGGAWTLAIALGAAVMIGKLRVEREVTERDARIGKLESDLQELRTELQSVNAKAEETLRSEHDASRREASELAKTNSMLIEKLIERRPS